ncbi:cyclase family protein [[Eubacterium] cellulosolvens]
MITRFSYLLGDRETVTSDSIGRLRITAKSEISKGERTNKKLIENLTTHTGTHIDVAYHMLVDGITLDELDISHFIFDHPLLLEISKSDFEKVTYDDLHPYEKQIRQSDILMIYTGFSRYREDDPDRYFRNQPGLSENATDYLTEFPNLRGVAVDLIGVENVIEGRKKSYPVHKILFKSFKKLVLLEDADLAALSGKDLKRVYLIPLFVKGADGSPVTAFAEYT